MLHEIGVAFDTLLFRAPPRTHEHICEHLLANEKVEDYVRRVALAKAEGGALRLHWRELRKQPVLSADTTLEQIRAHAAREPRIRAVALSRNFGKEIAIAAGLTYVDGDACIIMDADLQHPPEVLRTFVARWQEGYQVVYGQRLDRTAAQTLHRTERDQLSHRLCEPTQQRAEDEDAEGDQEDGAQR